MTVSPQRNHLQDGHLSTPTMTGFQMVWKRHPPRSALPLKDADGKTLDNYIAMGAKTSQQDMFIDEWHVGSRLDYIRILGT